jgi:hypothetical protein
MIKLLQCLCHEHAPAELWQAMLLITSCLPLRCYPQVAALVVDAVSEQGGLELWALHDLLERQQRHLQQAQGV